MPVTASPRLTGVWPARLAASRSIRLSPAKLGSSPMSRAPIAASQSIAAVVDEAGEIVAFKPGAVGDDQPGGGLERVEALGGGAEVGRER
jgi:hypothetical protein